MIDNSFLDKPSRFSCEILAQNAGKDLVFEVEHKIRIRGEAVFENRNAPGVPRALAFMTAGRTLLAKFSINYPAMGAEHL